MAVEDRIYSFGGYCTGDNYRDEKPIDVFVLNTNTFRWSEVTKPKEEAELRKWPFQRYGHTVVARVSETLILKEICLYVICTLHNDVFQGSTCYLFGGRNDEAACNLLFTFCSKTHTWSRPQVSGDIPGERDGHSAAIIGQHMFVFGGYEVSLMLLY